MHMADALLSPVVGGAFWVVSGALIGYSAKKIALENDHTRTPLMGVLGAFIFAAQMINFTIPGTGSSGHIGGGLLLSILLGPYRAFITLASVLVVQCLFFADGGIMALGSNIFNLAFFPAFIAYPLIYKKIAGNSLKPQILVIASIAAALTGLLFGSSSVIFQTVLSGITELPLKAFALFMIPIHSVIGIVEGLITFGVISFVVKTSPSLLSGRSHSDIDKKVVVAFVVVTLITGGVLSHFASSNPDGLEWSIENVSGKSDVVNVISSTAHQVVGTIQEKLSFFPDYSFKSKSSVQNDSVAEAAGTSVAGILGCVAVLLVSMIAAFFIRMKTQKAR